MLIVGCGDVLRRVLPSLVRRWRVIALVRERDPWLAGNGVLQIRGDLDQPHTLHRLAGIAEAVIHSAPPPGEGRGDPRTRRLLANLRRGKSVPRRMVYIGTTGIHGDCGGERVDETRTPAPATARAARRLDAERQLRFGGLRGCRTAILRSPGIYAGDRLPLDRLRAGLPLFVASEDSVTNHIHAEDLGRACLAALQRGRPGRCYTICDDSALPMGDWFDLLADRFGLPRAPRLPRDEVRRAVSPLQWSFMAESRRLVNARMKRELGLRLRYPTVADGVAAAIRHATGTRPCSG